MPHVIESASSARAKCRGCDQNIAKGELRFGERHPNTFGDGDMTLWFHLTCAAYTRPEPFLEALRNAVVGNANALASAAEFGIAHRRVPRVHGAERAPTGRARCRSCMELIERGAWRIPLVFFEEFRLAPSGFVHAACAGEYFETSDLIERIAHFRPGLSDSDIKDLNRELHVTSQP
ncbi:MAG TPA: PARP-type zinc finger-containing protein [Gammaproteobacteria bacterium]|nr:PARP-type zinc finger-containing protein [Gammaproteobacteria bacterium]